MSFFGNFAQIFASLSPRRRADDHQRPAQYRRNSRSQQRAHNARSTRCPSPSPTLKVAPRSSIKKRQNEFSLGSESDLDQPSDSNFLSAGDPKTSQTSQNYDNDFTTTSESPSSSRQLRSPPSQFVIDPDLGARLGDHPQMLSKDRQDEARLFGAQKYGDSNATPITPGATRKKTKPGASSAFQPTDRISKNSRESGPVRAQGKTTKAGVLTRRTQPQLDDAPVFDESGRPNKRRRQEGRNAVDLTEDSLAGPAIWNAEISPPANHVSRASPGSSQYSGKARSSGRHPRWLDEYRNVDDLVKIYRSPHLSQRGRLPSINSQDEQFTVQAAAQRRSLSHNEDRHPPQTNSSSPNQPRCNLLESIELHHGKETSKNLQPQPEALSQSPMLLNGSGNASGSRESSDEIQGEATTQPIPRNLDDRPIQGHRNVAREQPLSPARKRSPTDIRPTDFVRSPRRRSKKVKHQHESSDLTLLFISSIRFGNISKKVEKGEEVAIVLDDKKIQLGQDITGSRKVDIFFRYIRTALRAECHANRKVRLQLSHYEDAPGKIVDIDFLWQSDKIGFLKMVKEAEAAINLQFKEAEQMDQIFSKHEHEMANYALSSKRSLPDDSIERVSPPESTVPITRKKLSSLLQDDTGNSRQNQLKQPQSLSHVMDVADTSKEIEDDSDKGIDIPVKKSYGIFERTTRQTTRRTARLSGQTKSDEVISQGKLKSLLQKDPFRKKWQKPLVYPRVGKKKAEVNVEDRDRLRDDEFLNDNLIGFYMRFLQDHLERTNSEAAKHVYFFNSYFFATLTNKGAREINYSGVEKWTRNVDLFSYKYIVVPINQNAHWYVAIICNLPSLPLESASRVESPAIRAGDEERSNPAENEVQEIVESPEPEPIPASPEHPKDNTAKKAEDQSESPKSQATRASLASLSLDDFTNASNEADKLEDPASASEDWPDGEETNTSTPAKLSPPVQAEPVASTTAAKQLARQPKKKARGGHRLDPSQPTIITFDSLDLGRSPTIKLLRDYICQEAASKRGVEVNPTNIKGMRARAIPLQPNYSDCGLYLLAYTEKFVQNPDQFIAKLLQKEMDEHDDWPPLGSGLLRLRLRDFLDRLYEEQAQTKSDKGLMADQQPVSFLLGPPPPVQAVEDQNTVEIPYPNSSKVDNKSVDKEVHEKDDGLLNEESAEPNDSSGDTPQLVPTDSGPVRPPKDEPSRKPLAALPKPTASPGDSEVVEVPDSQEAPMASTEPKPRSRGEQKKPSKETDARLASRKSGRVEVQIRATPPPGTPKPARKSPRWQARKS